MELRKENIKLKESKDKVCFDDIIDFAKDVRDFFNSPLVLPRFYKHLYANYSKDGNANLHYQDRMFNINFSFNKDIHGREDLSFKADKNEYYTIKIDDKETIEKNTFPFLKAREQEISNLIALSSMILKDYIEETVSLYPEGKGEEMIGKLDSLINKHRIGGYVMDNVGKMKMEVK